MLNDETIRTINITFVRCIKEARLNTAGGVDLEYQKDFEQLPTTMRLLISKDGDSMYCFDKINENNIDKTSLEEILLAN